MGTRPVMAKKPRIAHNVLMLLNQLFSKIKMPIIECIENSSVLCKNARILCQFHGLLCVSVRCSVIKFIDHKEREESVLVDKVSGGDGPEETKEEERGRDCRARWSPRRCDTTENGAYLFPEENRPITCILRRPRSRNVFFDQGSRPVMFPHGLSRRRNVNTGFQQKKSRFSSVCLRFAFVKNERKPQTDGMLVSVIDVCPMLNQQTRNFKGIGRKRKQNDPSLCHNFLCIKIGDAFFHLIYITIVDTNAI